ncbi:MAG: hypothetical protein ACTHOG_07825 [Marmoricola sp.]
MGSVLSRVVKPPQAVWIGDGLGANPEHGLLLEWRRRKKRGREVWEGLVVYVVSYAGQDGDEWSLRTQWMEASRISPVTPGRVRSPH